MRPTAAGDRWSSTPEDAPRAGVRIDVACRSGLGLERLSPCSRDVGTSRCVGTVFHCRWAARAGEHVHRSCLDRYRSVESARPGYVRPETTSACPRCVAPLTPAGFLPAASPETRALRLPVTEGTRIPRAIRAGCTAGAGTSPSTTFSRPLGSGCRSRWAGGPGSQPDGGFRWRCKL